MIVGIHQVAAAIAKARQMKLGDSLGWQRLKVLHRIKIMVEGINVNVVEVEQDGSNPPLRPRQ